MKLLTVSVLVAACSVVWGCQKAAVGESSVHNKGRYQGVGLYDPGRMWSRGISANQPKDPALATTADDEKIIVVVDSNTGEIRQCGNLSGYCIAMNPWTKPLPPPQYAPLSVTKHDAELEQEDTAAAKYGGRQIAMKRHRSGIAGPGQAPR